MSNKLECTDSYLLPQGPKGYIGPDGPQGETGTRGPIGPQGDQGPTGRSKIDLIVRNGEAPYMQLEPGSGDQWVLVSTFIYPGNNNWGGDPTMLRIVTEANATDQISVGFLDLSEIDITISLDRSIASPSFITMTDTIKYSTAIGNINAPKGFPQVSNISLLPDTETPIGIVMTKPLVTGTVAKIYSIELY